MVLQYLKGVVYKKDNNNKKDGQACCGRTRSDVFKPKEKRYRLRHKEGGFLFDSKDGEAQEQVVQRDGRCPIPEIFRVGFNGAPDNLKISLLTIEWLD